MSTHGENFLPIVRVPMTPENRVWLTLLRHTALVQTLASECGAETTALHNSLTAVCVSALSGGDYVIPMPLAVYLKPLVTPLVRPLSS